MLIDDNEEKLLRSVALQTSHVILQARLRAEHELRQAKKELEEKARQLDHSLSILRATIESTADGILVTDENATFFASMNGICKYGRYPSRQRIFATIGNCWRSVASR